ncbi:MAG: glycosyltransferase family 39 protein, partial [Isosphaeraceae bacterium]
MPKDTVQRAKRAAGRMTARRGRALRVTWALAAACLLLLTSLVLARHGNLAWDDADYLRRGLADARLVAASSSRSPICRIADVLLQEQPKPPLLVAWLILGVPLLGRDNLDALIVLGSVLPFALLLWATVGVARRLQGDRAGLLALVLLVSSPSALSFGGKVMVETFLGLWVLLALALLALLAVRPSRRIGALLGLATGLALLTKLTAVLLLAGAAAVLAFWLTRSSPDRLARLRALGWALVACLVIAGPWYARNLPAAVRFGIFSTRFNLDVEGRSRAIAPLQRLLILVADLPGWPLAALLGAGGMLFLAREVRRAGAFGVGRTFLSDRDGQECPSYDRIPARRALARCFGVLTVACVIVATAALLFPHHFDSRFLLPLWPSLAVALGGSLARIFGDLAASQRLVVGAALAAGLFCAGVGLVREPVSSTCWNARGLIDELVSRHGVSSLANVGNTEGWNVCKTGLVNELRQNPNDCFVLHDLSAETGEALRGRLRRFDAVVVLAPSAFPAGFKDALPALNRGYSAIDQAIEADGELTRVQDLSSLRCGLPPLTCYVRRRGLASIPHR